MSIFYILLIFMIIAAIIAVETQDLLSSVICIGAIGFGASLMFLFLRAPDIAITQIVVEVLGLIILIRATISRDLTFITGDREFFGTVVSVVIIAVIFLAGLKILQTKSLEEIQESRQTHPQAVALPDFGTPIFKVASEALLFGLGSELQSDLDNGIISRNLRRAFEEKGTPLSQYVTVSIEKAGSRWLINDRLKTYCVRKEDDRLNIYPEAAAKTYIREGMQETGAANLVASVILDFRAYDTLGEATVLFTSIIGATVILRLKSKKRLEEIE